MARVGQRSLSSFAPVVPEPPANDPPLGPKGQHSDAWAEFFQKNTDVLNELTKAMRLVGRGVTDGSDAQPGYIGEVLTASGSVGLSNGVTATVATLTLTPGDWEVTGTVLLTATGANLSRYSAGIDAFGMEIPTSLPAGSGTARMTAGSPVRRNVTVNTPALLIAAVSFTGGGLTASGTVQARRMR